jgi:hypothetical protein
MNKPTKIETTVKKPEPLKKKIRSGVKAGTYCFNHNPVRK